MANQKPWVFLIQDDDKSSWGLTGTGLLVASRVGKGAILEQSDWSRRESLPDCPLVLVSTCSAGVSREVQTALQSQNCWVHFGEVRSDHPDVTEHFISTKWSAHHKATWGAMNPMPFSMTTQTPWDRCVRSFAVFLRKPPLEPKALDDALKKIERAWALAKQFYGLRQPLQRAVTFGFALFLQNDLPTDDTAEWLKSLKFVLESLDNAPLQQHEKRLVQRVLTDSSPCPGDLLLLADVMRRIEASVS